MLSDREGCWFMLKRWFVTAPENTMIQFARNMLAGIVGTAVDFAVLIFCKEIFLFGETLSAFIGFTAGLVLNYFICRCWVFPEAHQRNIMVDFISFMSIGFVGLLLTQIIIAPFSEHGLFGVGFFVVYATFGTKILPKNQYYIFGKSIAVVLVYFWNFFTRKKLLYRKYQ